MGDRTLTRSSYAAAMSAFVPSRGSATRAAEEVARKTGKLNPLVDPAEFGVIRRSLTRFNQRPDGLWVVTVGAAIPAATRLDTTGSMGDNVEHALWALPDTYTISLEMVPGCDLQVAIGIFADCLDDFVLCRPQYEMQAEKIIQQLTLMVPEGGGWGNGGEDPQYGLFGDAYLTDASINRIGLKGYDFTVTDEPAREYLSEQQLIRVFGPDVFDKVAENGFSIDRRDLPSTKQVIDTLLKRAHAFVLLVGNRPDATHFWPQVIDRSRIIRLPDIDLLPQVEASIIGLTEGTLSLDGLPSFLENTESHRYDRRVAQAVGATDDPIEAQRLRDTTLRKPTPREIDAIVRSVVNIPIGAQTVLPNFDRRPKKGDVFREKTDLWPMDPSEVPDLPETPDEPDGPIWGAEGQL